MEQFERIRRDFRNERLSIRALSERHKVHRRTVRQALADAVLPVRKVPERAAPVLGAHEVTIRRWLIEDLDCFIGACVVFVVVQSGRHATGNHIVAAEELA